MGAAVSNRYRVLLPLVVHTEDGSYEQGEEFEKTFTPEEERANVESGLLAVVPRRFKVVGHSNVDGTDPGGEFESDMTLAREELLVAGGHIARVVKPAKESKPKEAKS